MGASLRGNGSDAGVTDGLPVEGAADKNRRAVRLGVAFVAAIAVAFVLWMLVSGQAEVFARAVVHADPVWLVAGAGCFVGFFLLEMACFGLAGLLAGVRLGLRDQASVAAAGVVFGYLTPGQAAAAPAQIVRLSQVGLAVGDATAVQLTRYFIYQAAMTVLAGFVLAARFSFFQERFGQIVIVCVLAFGMHVAIMAGLVAVVFFPDLVRRLGHRAVALLSGRLAVVKEPQMAHARIDAEVDEYAGAVRSVVGHGRVVLATVFVTVLQLLFYYGIPYCVLRALGIAGIPLFDALCSTAFIVLVMTAVPLPGGAGGAEGGFALFFGPGLGPLTATGVVLWRLLSLYGPILASLPLLGLRSGRAGDGPAKGEGRPGAGGEAGGPRL